MGSDLHSSSIAIINAVALVAFYPTALVTLVSGLDDLLLNIFWLATYVRERRRPKVDNETPADSSPEKRLAIFVPCWQEHAVISDMVAHNLAAIRYRNYDIFVGAYPNDEATSAAVRVLERRFEQVHLAICPHDGPTSKADCLNWIYQCMLLYEESQGLRFDVIVTHDAEDLIDPNSLSLLNREADRFDMIQIPVLPICKNAFVWTTGVYCDEFAEYQSRDMPLRQAMGSFVPSNGVGTGYVRAALERLATTESNRIFEPSSLTEDYENGVRLRRLGCRQAFLPLRRSATGFAATREMFPDTRRTAVSQRTRWVTGIALQTWSNHGWRGDWATRYWFWRDRKGVLCNPLGLLGNILFAYGALL